MTSNIDMHRHAEMLPTTVLAAHMLEHAILVFTTLGTTRDADLLLAIHQRIESTYDEDNRAAAQRVVEAMIAAIR